MTQDKPKILRIDCTTDVEICDIWKGSVPAANNTYPYLMIATNVRAYAYVDEQYKSLPIKAEAIFNDFLSNAGYKKFPVHGGKGKTTKDLIRGGHEYVAKKQREFDLARAAEEGQTQGIVSATFERLFAKHIGFLFYSIGLDFWQARSKITLFITGVLVPASILVYYFVRIILLGHRIGADDKEKYE